MLQKKSISVIIPVYNSYESLEKLVERLIPVLEDISDQFEILLVNDGSKDNSWQKICSLSDQFEAVRGINLMRNYGQHNAILCGIRSAQFEISITMDDDLQHPPEEIHKLLEELEKGFDVVYGSPEKMPHSPFRNFSSWLSKHVLAFVMGIKTVKHISAFRALRTNLRQAFNDYSSPGVILDVLLTWGTTKFSYVMVKEDPREIGQSNYTFRKLLSQVFLILTGYSTVPLRLASIMGFTFTLFGLGVFIYVLIVYFVQGSIPGWPFLASIIAIFSGTQMFTLGIFGEYLARIFDKSMDRPTYVIKKITKNGEKK